MTIEEMRARLAQLAAEGAALATRHGNGEALTDAEIARIGEIRAEATELRAKLAAAVDRQAALDEFRQLDQEFNQPAAGGAQRQIATHGPGTGGQRGESGEPSHWTMGDRFVHSDELAQFRANLGQGRGMRPVPVGSFYPEHERRARLDAMAPEQRALITSTTVTEMILPDRLTGILEGIPRRLRARDVMANRQTDSNLVEFVRRASRTNNAAEVAEATNLSTGLKPESGFTLETDSSPVRTIAHIEYATRNALDDMAQLRGIIEGDLRRGIEEREDLQLLFGDGVSPNLRGVYNTPGIQNLDATYWGANPLESGGADANKWDRLVRAITQVDDAGQSVASAVVLHPSLVEQIRIQKDSTGNYLFAGGGPQGNGILTIWGLPIVPHASTPTNVPLVGDFARHATVYDRMQSQVYATDANRDLFERNIITFLAESRLALVVDWPAAFVKVDLVG